MRQLFPSIESTNIQKTETLEMSFLQYVISIRKAKVGPDYIQDKFGYLYKCNTLNIPLEESHLVILM